VRTRGKLNSEADFYRIDGLGGLVRAAFLSRGPLRHRFGLREVLSEKIRPNFERYAQVRRTLHVEPSMALHTFPSSVKFQGRYRVSKFRHTAPVPFALA